jgi:predicted  nucleic acid-binding Zn-ribbon protein
MSEERFDRIEQRLDRLESGQQELKTSVSDLGARIDGLDRNMHVLHEDVIGRIAAIPEYSGPSKAEFAELKEMIGRRLDPLEAVVRQQ